MKRDPFEKERISSLLSLRPGIRVLDIGCGVARWAEALLPFVSENGEYVGVDFSEDILSLEKAHFSHQKNCQFLCAEFQNLLYKLPLAMIEKSSILFSSMVYSCISMIRIYQYAAIMFVIY